MTTSLFTKEQLRQLPKLYETENINIVDKKVIVKLFHPASGWTWYVIEYDGNDRCFGLVKGNCIEFGYFSLAELAEIKGPFGLRIERDKWFSPMTIGEILARTGL